MPGLLHGLAGCRLEAQGHGNGMVFATSRRALTVKDAVNRSHVAIKAVSTRPLFNWLAKVYELLLSLLWGHFRPQQHAQCVVLCLNAIGNVAQRADSNLYRIHAATPVLRRSEGFAFQITSRGLPKICEIRFSMSFDRA